MARKPYFNRNIRWLQLERSGDNNYPEGDKMCDCHRSGAAHFCDMAQLFDRFGEFMFNDFSIDGPSAYA